MVVVSALLFGAFHWWTDIPSVFNAVAFGLAFKLIYQGSGALWP